MTNVLLYENGFIYKSSYNSIIAATTLLLDGLVDEVNS
jgi:hypothetical protein